MTQYAQWVFSGTPIWGVHMGGPPSAGRPRCPSLQPMPCSLVVGRRLYGMFERVHTVFLEGLIMKQRVKTSKDAKDLAAFIGPFWSSSH